MQGLAWNEVKFTASSVAPWAGELINSTSIIKQQLKRRPEEKNNFSSFSQAAECTHARYDSAAACVNKPNKNKLNENGNLRRSPHPDEKFLL
jgi:hypothetical protein